MQENQQITKKEQYNLNKLQKRLRRNVGEAIADFNMIEMKADVVVANILAGPLRELAPLISVLPVSGGLLGLSGILASQAE
ncbi:50S ribosomal protein L11 methyltransferase, partial [Escherichia coli]|uniref:50S ribosomal protein L11 methyltransferase n=1 Tax=Escherichia coli TaxID=562 RepID=UPI0035221B35